jgi:hypothetical protein
MIYCLFHALLVAGLLIGGYAVIDAIKNAK